MLLHYMIRRFMEILSMIMFNFTSSNPRMVLDKLDASFLIYLRVESIQQLSRLHDFSLWRNMPPIISRLYGTLGVKLAVERTSWGNEHFCIAVNLLVQLMLWLCFNSLSNSRSKKKFLYQIVPWSVIPSSCIFSSVSDFWSFLLFLHWMLLYLSYCISHRANSAVFCSG